MTWDLVCEELVAQHSKLHERESKGGGFSGGKSFKPSAHGKGGYQKKAKDGNPTTPMTSRTCRIDGNRLRSPLVGMRM